MNAIEFENISKIYRLGRIGTGTLSHDLNRWWCRVRGKEDPYLKVGQVNDRARSSKEGDYVWALKDITFNVEQGDVVAIIGKNGAGKSTLLKILSKVTTPTTGIIRARGRIASLLEVGTGFHDEMTGRENIFMNGTIMGMTRSEIARKLDEIVDFAGVAMYLDTPVKRYSSGMKVRLGFAVAAFLEPEILVVDEVLAVGDAEFQKKAIGKMQDVAQGQGRTVLFVSHNMSAVKSLCKKGILLDNGCVSYSGSVQDTVAFYLNSADAIEENVQKVLLADKKLHRGNPAIRFFSIERMSRYEMAVDEELCFSVEIENIQLELPYCHIIGFIVNAFSGERVGCFVTSSIKTPILGSRKKIEIRIAHHHLSKGKYYMDWNILDRDVFSPFSAYDLILHTVSFQVSYMKGSLGDSIHSWSNRWGHHLYDVEIIEK